MAALERAGARDPDTLLLISERTLEDLLGTLAWVRELVSMIHLAKFTGAPASRAEELVAQIAAAVEGLSALTWQEGPLARQDGDTEAWDSAEKKQERMSGAN